MSYRYMRIMVMFDLPTLTLDNKREYTRFRKFLVKSGFMMLQESVYCKLALNTTVADAVIRNIKKNKPNDGLVQMIMITEKQFSKMEMVVGSYTSNVLDTDQRMVIL